MPAPLHSKGFAHLGLIIGIVIVIAAIAFGGWYVWDKNRDNKSANNSQPQQNDPPEGAKYPSSTKEEQYSDARYSFNYPASWSVDPSGGESVILKSADYEEARLIEAQSPYYVTSQGNMLAVSEIPSTAPNATLEELMAHIESEEAERGGGSHKQIAVDGHQTLWVNNKHEDTYLYVVVFYDQKRIHIQLNAKDDADPSTAKLFDAILASFKFK